MPRCHRLEKNRQCRYWCKPNWIFCHNFYDGFCREEVVEHQCVHGWHITEKRYRAIKNAEQFSDDRESNHRKWKRCPEVDEAIDSEASRAKKCKRDPLLEVYLRRFGYKPDEMPDRREIEDAFVDTTFTKVSHRDQGPAPFTYEEYSEAFQYIVDIITNGVAE